MPKKLTIKSAQKRIKGNIKKIRTLQSRVFVDRKTIIEKFGVCPLSKEDITKEEKIKPNVVRLYFTDLELEKLDKKRGEYKRKEYLKYIFNKYLL